MAQLPSFRDLILTSISDERFRPLAERLPMDLTPEDLDEISEAEFIAVLDEGGHIPLRVLERVRARQLLAHIGELTRPAQHTSTAPAKVRTKSFLQRGCGCVSDRIRAQDADLFDFADRKWSDTEFMSNVDEILDKVTENRVVNLSNNRICGRFNPVLDRKLLDLATAAKKLILFGNPIASVDRRHFWESAEAQALVRAGKLIFIPASFVFGRGWHVLVAEQDRRQVFEHHVEYFQGAL